MFYVYMLLDPRKDNQPFYVGKGTGERYKDHLTESLSSTPNRRKYHKIQKIIKSGHSVGIKIVKEFDDETMAYNFEEELIKKYGRKDYDPGGILMNICLNAKPPRYWEGPDAAQILDKIKQSRAKNPYTHSSDIRQKISAATKGKPKKPRTAEHKASLSAALKGKPLSRACTQETRIKRSLNQKGKKISEEIKNKISQKLRGRVITEEHKEKIRQSMLKRKNGPRS